MEEKKLLSKKKLLSTNRDSILIFKKWSEVEESSTACSNTNSISLNYKFFNIVEIFNRYYSTLLSQVTI